MRVLIVNDDGIHSVGLHALAKRVHRDGNDVFVVAPREEQSGVSQAITFLEPIFPQPATIKLSADEVIPGCSVDGTPVDCLKLGVHKLCPWKPDLVLSGINGGLNAGINVGHSGTVGGALAAATFGIPSVAMSLEYSLTNSDFAKAADILWPLVQNLIQAKLPAKSTININVPLSALSGNWEVEFVPVETNPMAYHFQQGEDPRGRQWFWSTNLTDPEPSSHPTDTQMLLEGKITVSVISYDLNHYKGLDSLASQVR
ncbi:MAG: 5'/3'-nucleotidase SurE [Planctomycetota bacterium]